MFEKMKFNAKMMIAPAAGVLATMGTVVPAFASGPAELPNVAITTEMLTPLVEGVVANVGVILPVGIGLMAISIGIRILPKLINKFTRF